MFKPINPRGACKLVISNSTQHRDSQSDFISFAEKNLIDLDIITTDSDDTSVGQNELMDELEVLRKMVAEEESKRLLLEKEKEKATMNALLERDSLLRRMSALQGYNKELENSSTTLNKELFGDIPMIKDIVKKYENALQPKDDPIISQVHPYEPINK